MDETEARPAKERAGRLLISLVRLGCGAVELLLVAHIVLSLGDVNPDNPVPTFVATWADRLALGLNDLFTPANETLRVIFNYGAAVVAWIAIGGLLTSLLRRATAPPYEIS